MMSFLFLMTCTNLCAQDFEKDIQKMYQVFAESDAMILEAKTDLYSGHSKAPIETSLSIMKRSGQDYYCHFNGVDLLVNSEYKVMVNHDLKAVAFGELSAEEKRGQEAFEAQDVMAQIEVLAQGQQEVVFKGLKNKVKHYHIIKNKKEGIQDVHFFLNTQNHFPVRIEYSYSRETEDEGELKSKVVVNYQRVDFQPSFSMSDFSEGQYFKKKNDQYELSAQYKAKGYELFNLKDFEL